MPATENKSLLWRILSRWFGPATPAANGRVPAPGDIWWADIPFEERRGSKDRPCLVISAAGRYAKVLMITSQDKSGRDNYLPLLPQVWRRPSQHSSVRSDRLIRIPISGMRRIEGRADEQTLRTLTRRYPALRNR